MGGLQQDEPGPGSPSRARCSCVAAYCNKINKLHDGFRYRRETEQHVASYKRMVLALEARLGPTLFDKDFTLDELKAAAAAE